MVALLFFLEMLISVFLSPPPSAPPPPCFQVPFGWLAGGRGGDNHSLQCSGGMFLNHCLAIYRPNCPSELRGGRGGWGGRGPAQTIYINCNPSTSTNGLDTVIYIYIWLAQTVLYTLIHLTSPYGLCTLYCGSFSQPKCLYTAINWTSKNSVFTVIHFGLTQMV